MRSFDVIVAGSLGRVGPEVCNHLKSKGLQILELDLELGHDLSNEEWVINFFKDNKAKALINLFAMNEHISETGLMAQSLIDFSLESFDQYMHINLTTLFSVCRQFADNNKKSNIVNFSSIYGVRPPHRDLYNGGFKHVGYTVSKAGVIALSEYLALALAPNVRVNTIVPGGIIANQSSEFLEKYSAKCPMGRMSEVSDLFGIIDLLISDTSSYITGATIPVDGGWTL
jgi:NAD(P)-dependent dehydrogenase (short-subunit alcohol dehydrogenase family)